MPEVATVAKAPEAPPVPTVLRRRVVDDKNIIVTRVPLTPSMCDICGADLAEINKLPAWDDLSTKKQMELREVVKEHKKVQHPDAG